MLPIPGTGRASKAERPTDWRSINPRQKILVDNSARLYDF
jgi:hypothetical protein